MDDFLTKPVDPEALTAVLATRLGRGRAHTGSTCHGGTRPRVGRRSRPRAPRHAARHGRGRHVVPRPGDRQLRRRVAGPVGCDPVRRGGRRRAGPPAGRAPAGGQRRQPRRGGRVGRGPRARAPRRRRQRAAGRRRRWSAWPRRSTSVARRCCPTARATGPTGCGPRARPDPPRSGDVVVLVLVERAEVAHDHGHGRDHRRDRCSSPRRPSSTRSARRSRRARSAPGRCPSARSRPVGARCAARLQR